MEHHKRANSPEHYEKVDSLKIEEKIEMMDFDVKSESLKLERKLNPELQQLTVLKEMANPDSTLESPILDLSCKRVTTLSTDISSDLTTNLPAAFTSSTQSDQLPLSLLNNFPMICGENVTRDITRTTAELKLSKQMHYEEASRNTDQTDVDIDQDKLNNHINNARTINNNQIDSQSKNLLFPEHLSKQCRLIRPISNSHLWLQSTINPASIHMSPTTPLQPSETRHIDLIKKVPRPFKAYPKDPLRLSIGSQYYDTNSNLKYKEYRQKMLERIKQTNEVTNNKMRRVPRSGSPTSTVEEKDAAYWERRRRNNEAAKRSRDARRAKEDELAIRAAFLENENIKLKSILYQIYLEAEKRNISFNIQTDYDFRDIFMSQMNSKDR